MVLFIAAPGSAEQTETLGGPYGTGWYQVGPYNWDLTKCDLTLSYTLDLSGTSGFDRVAVGFIDPVWNAGYMQSHPSYAAQTNDLKFDIDDNHYLNSSHAGYGATRYNVLPDGSIVDPPFGSNSNYGFWFDRDGVDQWQQDMFVDGGNYNTNGIYEIIITYRYVDTLPDGSHIGTMLATINDLTQDFPSKGIVGAGKSLAGDLTALQLYWQVSVPGATVSDISVTGCRGNVWIDGCDTGVEDRSLANGSYLSWELGSLVGNDWKNHGQFVSSVSKWTAELVEMGLISSDERNAIIECAAKSDVGKKGKMSK